MAPETAADSQEMERDLMGEIPVCSTDGNGRILAANKAFAALLGYRHDEVADLNFGNLTWPAPARDGLWHVAAGADESDVPQELTLPRKDATVLTALAYRKRATARDGKPLVTWMLIDVSRYKRAMLNQQAFLDSVALGVFVTENRIIRRTNPMADEMFRAPSGSLIGKPGVFVFPSQAAYEKLGAAASPVLAAGGKFECELDFRRMTGELFPCYLRAKAVDPWQPELGTVWILEDRTELKAAENALRKTHDELEAIVDNAMIGMFKVENRRIVWCNRKLEELLGYEHGELDGQPTRVCYESDADWAALGEVYKELVGGAVRTQERVLRRKDGSRFWCLMSGKALDPNDPVKSAIWLFEDITQRKEVELALLEAHRQAEQATRAKSMFLANMSHEIRTPMNAVIGLSGLMLKMDLPPKERDYTEKIHAAGTALLRIIDDILDFTKIEAGKLELENADFRIDAVLDHAATLLGGKARDKGLEVLFDVPPSVPRELNGDSLRLGQILTNLLGNAIKFTERGQIVVRVREQASSDADVMLRFDVQDSGIGVPAAETKKLFQPFCQVDSSDLRKHGGTGLGLSICKRLVELMGGDISVTSAPGVGSSFSFTARFGRSAAANESGHSLPAFLDGMHVLVVDDNPEAQDIRLQSLSAFKFRVDVAGTGPEAVEAVRRHDASDPYRIVFMDWKMPDVNGLDATRRIKASESLRSPPDVVMITASGCGHLRTEAENAGVDVFLTKPVSQAALEGALLSLFPAEESDLPAPGVPLPTRTCGDLRGLRVLLVEDNDTNRQIATALLESEGVVVGIANNGRDALRRLMSKDCVYDAVLMDLQMPEMDGFEATSRLRADSRFRDLPVIALTARATMEERQRCLDAGMNEHVTKPLDPDVLFDTLLRCCGKQGKNDPAGQVGLSSMGQDSHLPAIPGVDAAQGLKRVAGNRGLYDKLLTAFIETHIDLAQRVRKLMDDGDPTGASKEVHAFAGAAGNVGAKAAWRLATKLERALRAPDQIDNILRLNEALAQEIGYLAWAWRTMTGRGNAWPQPADPVQ